MDLDTLDSGETLMENFTAQDLQDPDKLYSGLDQDIPDEKPSDFKVQLIDPEGEVNKVVLKSGKGWERPEDCANITVNIIATDTRSGKIDEKKELKFVIGDGSVDEKLEQIIMTMRKGEHSTVELSYSNISQEGASLQEAPDTLETNHIITYDLEMVSFENVRAHPLQNSERIKFATKLKEAGNLLFKKCKLETAIRKYCKALEFVNESYFTDEDRNIMKELRLACLLNIAAARLTRNEFEAAKEQSTMAIELDKKSAKAFFRRGRAFVGLKDYDEAQKDFDKSLELDPSNAQVKQELKAIKQVKMKQKEKEKEFFQNMFKKPVSAEIASNKSQPTSFIERLAESLMTPGVPKEHFTFMNLLFLGLILLVLFIILMMGNNVSIHVYILLALAVGTLGGVQWFVSAANDNQEKDKKE